jgi:DNA modification methylase
MGGEKADLVLTDPPYGMGLDTYYSSMKNKLEFAEGKNIKNGKKYAQGIVDDFKPELITAVFENFGYCKEIFLWGADYYAEMLENKNEGSWIVWDKRSNEWDKDTTETFDKMFGSCFELCWSKAKHKRDIARVKWAGVYGTETEFDKKRFHPTQKPIKLIKYFLSRYAKENEVIVDLYGGSGSTLIAAEELDMRARVMELDPHYCDVIRKRWTKWAQENGRKVGSGGLE